MNKKFYLNIIGGFLAGAILLCIFSAIQKYSIGVDISILQGYIVPFLFGSISGALIGYFNYQMKRNLSAKLKLERELSEKLEIKVEKKTKDLKSAKNLLELLNNILIHDILNDLNTIRGNLDLFLTNKKESYVFESKKCVNNSFNTIANLSKLKDIVSPDYELKNIRLRGILEELVNKYPADINIEIRGDAQVLADEALISVFDNLIHNTIEHSGSNKISIHISEKNKTFFRILFKDEGKGIPPKVREHLFDKGVKSKYTGNMGFGLYLVKNTIERYGGLIEVKDNEPKGTIFVITLRRYLETQ
ncbi:MAG: GHKL domain-containing protein [Candidatus Lokiarchaeota archaeon]|nr:GHKL domain-containing protein [Candidatus Lokiarchaeota archaeon]